MRTLTFDERGTIALAIANALREIGHPVTEEAIRAQFPLVTTALDASESRRRALSAYAPPDSYAPTLKALRACTCGSRTETVTPSFRTTRPTADDLTQYAAPDAYARDLKAAKERR